MRFKTRAVIFLLILAILASFVNVGKVEAAEAGPSIFENGAKKAIIVKKAAYIDYETAKKYQQQRSEPIDILVNSNNSNVDQWIKDHIKNKGISDVIVLGGLIVFTDNFGQNLGINLIRCGGWNASDTERIFFNLGNKVYNPTQIYHESGKNYGVSVSETSKFTSSIQTSIRNKLAAKDYFGAVDIILGVKPHGSEQRSKDGNYAIAIVLDDTYFYSYSNIQTTGTSYCIVHSYVYPGRLPTQKTVKKPTLNLNESWTNSNRSFTVSPDPTCTVTSYVEYKIGNGSWTKGTSGTVTAEGQTTVYARAVNDTPGGKKYSETVSKVARIDKTKPSATINPNSSSWTNSNINFTVTLSDSGGSGLKQWRIRYSSDDGATYGSWSSWNTTTSYSHYLDVEGRRKIQVEVHDNAGNTNIITSGSYLIDKKVPTHVSGSISGYRYKDGSGDYWIRPGDTISVIMRGSDALSGILRHYIRFLGINQTTGDIRYYHDWTQASNHMTTWDNFGNNSHVEVLSVERTYNSNGQREVKWQAKLKTDGQSYAAQYYYYDYAWNGIGYNTIGNVRVDGTAPTISISPNSQSWVKGNINVTITATDSGSGVKRIEYMVSTNNGATWPSTWTQVSGNSTTITLSNTGEYKIRARAVDNVDNTSAYKESGKYQIDKQAPDPPTLTLSPDGWTNGNVTATISGGNDAHSGIAKYQYSFDNTNWADYSGAITISNEGTTRIYARTVDKVGNASASVYKDAKIERKAPSVSFNPNSQDWTSQNITVTITASDTGGSGVKEFYYQISNPGGNTWPNDWIKISGSSTTVELSTGGVYRIRAYAIDNAGNTNQANPNVSGEYKIDKIVPSVTFNPNGNDVWKKQHSTTVTVSDGQSGIDTTSLEYAWSTSASAPSSGWASFTNGATITSPAGVTGNYYLYVKARDKATPEGNVTMVRSNVFKIDNTAPTAPTITLSTENWTNQNVTVTISGGSDSHSGVNRIEYRINGGSWTVYSSSFNITNEGITTVEARTVDNAGNVSSIVSKQAKIDRTAPTPPIITVNPSTWTNQNVTVTISPGSDSGSGVHRIEYRINGGSWTTYSSPFVLQNQGIYTIEARTIDLAQNASAIANRQVLIDKTSPTVSATPSSRGWSNTDVVVTVSFSDSGGSGLSTRQYVWSTSTTAPSSGWQNYSSASGTLIQSSQGSWYLYLRAYDTAGNTVTQRFGPYQIDKTSPTISANPSSRGWGNTNVDVVLTYEDSGGSGLSQRQYAWSQSTSTPSSWTNYSSAVSQSGEGVWYLHARAVDVAGNVTIRRFGPYEIDKTSPSHVSHSITEYRYKKGNDYWIRANDTVKYRMRGKDALSGIRYSYARLVGLGGVDVRSQHDWSGAVDHNNQFQTSEQIAIVKAERIYDGEGQREIEWTINSKEYENDFDVQYYYTDNAGNSIGYISTGIKLRVDATKPDVVISRVNGDVLFSESLIITVTDSRSGLKTVKYSWSFSTSTPSSWTDVSDRIVNNTAVVEINPTIPGPMYLHYYVEDNVGNVASGYAGQYNVIDDSISLDGLALVRVVNPPHGTRVPVVYPVDVPPAVNAGYKLDFAMAVTGADEADIRLYDQDGNRLAMYTTAGAVQTLTILIPSTDSNVVRFTFWLDKEMEEGTILDMEIILRRTLPGGRTTMIGNDTLGKNVLKITGTAKDNWKINLTK